MHESLLNFHSVFLDTLYTKVSWSVGSHDVFKRCEVDSNEYNSSYRLIFYLDKSTLKLVKLKSLHVVKYEYTGCIKKNWTDLKLLSISENSY
jgi:hypothetical protein